MDMETISIKENEMIKEFQGEHRFLSNFWYVPIIYEGIKYPTSEHAYQAAKTFDKKSKIKISELSKPGDAKRFGQKVLMRPDWESIKIQIMEDILRIKFTNKIMRQKLINTGDQEIQEGNRWNDRFWGIDLRTGIGKNHLGRILMKIREEINEE